VLKKVQRQEKIIVDSSGDLTKSLISASATYGQAVDLGPIADNDNVRKSRRFNRMCKVGNYYQLCGQAVSIDVCSSAIRSLKAQHHIYLVPANINATKVMELITERAFFDETMGVVIDPTTGADVNELYDVVKKNQTGCALAIMLPDYEQMYEALERGTHQGVSLKMMRFPHNLDLWFREVFFGQFEEVHVAFSTTKEWNTSEHPFTGHNAWMSGFYSGMLKVPTPIVEARKEEPTPTTAVVGVGVGQTPSPLVAWFQWR